MAIVHIGMGSNMGDREAHLKNALFSLRKNLGIFLANSSLYETKPWGYASSKTYYNAVVKFETEHTPQEVLTILHYIEASNGRERSNQERYSDRTLDLDLLYYDELEISEQNLTIPHPQILNRSFVVIPLLEITPNFIDFKSKKSLKEISLKGQYLNEISTVLPFSID